MVTEMGWRKSAPLLCVFLLLLAAAFSSEANQPTYRDPSKPAAARIRDLLKRMTLAEKIGQMTQIERSIATPDIMKQYSIGKHMVIIIVMVIFCSF